MIGKRWLSVVVLGMFVALASVCWAAPGDVDGVNGVELKDAVTALQVSAGLAVGGVTLEGDVNGDDAIGVAEAVYALREVASSTQGKARAVLGPLAGATVNVYRLGDLETPIYTDTTDAEGYFDTQVDGIPSGEYLLVAVSGGEDTDADDDGIPDAVPTPNAGTIHALVTAAEFNQGGFQVTAISDIVWQYTKNLVGDVDSSGFKLRLDELAKTFILSDFNGDEKIDAEDVLAFLPTNESHQTGLNFDFGDLFAENADGHSIIDAYHENLVDVLPTLLEEQFWSRLTLAPGVSPLYKKLKIEVASFGEGKVTSDIGGIDIDSERSDSIENVSHAFFDASATEKITLSATPTSETEILSWSGCNTVSEDKTQCECSLKTDRLVTVSFGYKDTIVQEGVTVIDLSDSQVAMSDDQVTLNVTADAGDADLLGKLSELKAGDVVVGSQGLGFLRAVVSVQKSSETNYIITSGDISLEEIIAQGTAAFSKQMTHGDLADETKRRSRMDAFSGDGFHLVPSDDPNDTVFRLVIGNPNARAELSGELRWPSDNAKIVLKGSLDVSIKIDFGVGIKAWPPGVGYVRFIPEIQAEESLDLSVIAEVDLIDQEIPIGSPIKFAPITVSIGPVPVVITPEIQLVLGFQVTASGEVTAGISFKQTARCGFVYNRGAGFETVADFTTSNGQPELVASASAGVVGYVQVKPVLYLWGITGPAIKAKAYIKVKGEAERSVFENDPCSGGISFTAYNGTQYSFEWDLGAAKKLGKWAEDVKLEAKFKPKEDVLKIWNHESLCDARPPFMEVFGLNVNKFVAEGAGEIVRQVYTVKNSGDLEMDWEVRYLEDGAAIVGPTSGKLTAGESTTITATVNTAAISLGQYTNYLKFINKYEGGLLTSYPTGSTWRIITINIVSPDDPVVQQDRFTNSLGMTFVRIPAGTFMMGSPEDELGAEDIEWPQHQVTLSQDFYMMTTEVTQAQWVAVMGGNPSNFEECGGDCPVETVSWEDTQDYIASLSALEEINYRLPTEAEWEYAARAGTTTAFYNGGITVTDYSCDLDPNLDAIGWYCGNSDGTPHPVAQKQPNAWGLYDMLGNVLEWVEDDLHWGYDGAPVDGSAWIYSPRSIEHVFRGGFFGYSARLCRSARRDANFGLAMFKDHGVGFRLALSAGR